MILHSFPGREMRGEEKRNHRAELELKIHRSIYDGVGRIFRNASIIHAMFDAERSDKYELA